MLVRLKVAAGIGACRTGWTIGLASALLMSIPAGAQADAEPNDTQVQSEGALQEIVVTANKRSKNIQNVPIALRALG